MGRPPAKRGSTALPLLPFNEIQELVAGAWMTRGACTGSQLDFTSERERVDDKLAVCDTCPVKHECLHYAVVTADEVNIAGGMRPGARIPFDNGQRYQVCTQCGAGFVWAKNIGQGHKVLCRSCVDHPTRYPDGSRQHFNINPPVKESA